MTLLERLGGKAAVNAAVDLFYTKILSDDGIKDIWAGIKMGTLKYMMKRFLVKATGGESDYQGRNMYDAHKHVNNGEFPTETQYNVVVKHLVAALQELGVKDDLIGEVADIVNTIKPYILGLERPPDAKTDT